MTTWGWACTTLLSWRWRTSAKRATKAHIPSTDPRSAWQGPARVRVAQRSCWSVCGGHPFHLYLVLFGSLWFLVCSLRFIYRHRPSQPRTRHHPTSLPTPIQCPLTYPNCIRALSFWSWSRLPRHTARISCPRILIPMTPPCYAPSRSLSRTLSQYLYTLLPLFGRQPSPYFLSLYRTPVNRPRRALLSCVHLTSFPLSGCAYIARRGSVQYHPVYVVWLRVLVRQLSLSPITVSPFYCPVHLVLL